MARVLASLAFYSLCALLCGARPAEPFHAGDSAGPARTSVFAPQPSIRRTCDQAERWLRAAVRTPNLDEAVELVERALMPLSEEALLAVRESLKRDVDPVSSRSLAILDRWNVLTKESLSRLWKETAASNGPLTLETALPPLAILHQLRSPQGGSGKAPDYTVSLVLSTYQIEAINRPLLEAINSDDGRKLIHDLTHRLIDRAPQDVQSAQSLQKVSGTSMKQQLRLFLASRFKQFLESSPFFKALKSSININEATLKSLRASLGNGNRIKLKIYLPWEPLSQVLTKNAIKAIFTQIEPTIRPAMKDLVRAELKRRGIPVKHSFDGTEEVGLGLLSISLNEIVDYLLDDLKCDLEYDFPDALVDAMNDTVPSNELNDYGIDLGFTHSFDLPGMPSPFQDAGSYPLEERYSYYSTVPYWTLSRRQFPSFPESIGPLYIYEGGKITADLLASKPLQDFLRKRIFGQLEEKSTPSRPSLPTSRSHAVPK